RHPPPAPPGAGPSRPLSLHGLGRAREARRGALRGRAAPARARDRRRLGSKLPRPRRADEPSRPRESRGARGRAGGVSGDGAARLPRPSGPRRCRNADDCGRRARASLPRRRMGQLRPRPCRASNARYPASTAEGEAAQARRAAAGRPSASQRARAAGGGDRGARGGGRGPRAEPREGLGGRRGARGSSPGARRAPGAPCSLGGAVRADAGLSSGELFDVLRELVEIESPTGETRALGERLASELETLGGRAQWLGEHVRADFGGREPPLLLLGHLDTVWDRGTLAGRPFRVAGDRAFGPGVCDMKGGLAIALAALRQSEGDRRALRVFLSADEEDGSVTAREPIAHAARGSAAALVVEPSTPDGAVKTARSGLARYRLRVEGSSGDADAGAANAVEELARQIVDLLAFD